MAQRTKTHLLWDGKSFLSVKPEEAQKMVAEDKAQDLTSQRASSYQLKPRSAFTGYNTAAPAKVEAPETPKPEKSGVDPADGPGKAIQDEPLKNWMAYKNAVAKDLDKPFNKVTKADVEQWWADGNRE